MITKLKNWNLIVPKSINKINDNIIWDWYIEIKKDDPSYEKYLKMYQHDKKIEEEINALLTGEKH